jgi:hypothetical protein
MRGRARQTTMGRMPVSRKPLRLVGYVRVSDVGGRSGASFISPAAQRERIAAWCSLYDAHLQHVFEELDQSGGRTDRPLLLNAIERVERGLSDGIIVAKLDRFGRSFKDASSTSSASTAPAVASSPSRISSTWEPIMIGSSCG